MDVGYYRFPTINEDTVIFVSEDDLWTVSAEGGIARRLTSNLGEVSRPWLSPDGKQVAFVGREEGQAEIYVMPALGGAARRLSFLGGTLCLTSGWTNDGKILFANNAEHWYLRFTHLFTLDPDGGSPERLSYGEARGLAYGPDRGVLLNRTAEEPARWKRYRGGRIGKLWVDRYGDGNFGELLAELGNLHSGMWIGEKGTEGRIYFICDHEGVGNLYSCLPSGEDLHRCTHHEDFYVRNASTDGKKIVYHAGADLYIYNPGLEKSTLIDIEYHSPRVQRNRKFIDPSKHLESWVRHPKSQSIAISVRGKIFSFANWEGAVHQHGKEFTGGNGDHPKTSIRFRMPEWLHDGKRLITVCDCDGEERFEIYNVEDEKMDAEILTNMDFGRPVAILANPKRNQIAFTNNRYELFVLDLDDKKMRLIDRGKADFIVGFDWSPDGNWLAYSVSLSLNISILRLWNSANGEITDLTKPVLVDIAPKFDPSGKYLYFISYRTFDPVYDRLQFELSFPRGMKPYLITLQKDLTSPFIPTPKMDGESKDKIEGKDGSDLEEDTKSQVDNLQEKEQPGAAKDGETKSVKIDLDGIQGRVLAFPVPEGIYGKVVGIAEDKVLYSRYPVEGALSQPVFGEDTKSKGTLMIYNFEEQKDETLITGMTDYKVSRDGKTLIYLAEDNLRILKAGEKPPNEDKTANRQSGWVNLSRVKIQVLPGAEWRQMYREAWRLQRDQFWTEDMSKIDWMAIYNRYLPLVDRVASRSEFSDLMWEMQGELGTSHAYEFGGDYRPEPKYVQGYLGAETKFEPEMNAWKITRINRGDSWDAAADSPLSQPGINVNVGDYLVAVNGKRLTEQLSPAEALVNLAGEEVCLTVLTNEAVINEGEKGTVERTVTVKTLRSEMMVRYRQWIENNRQIIHKASGGKIGYVHIPDMMAWGFAEFHRGYLVETQRDGLIVDVRYNRGGHVSELLLEKLARKRIAYVTARWLQEPVPYPEHSVAGPMVAITNEFAGSDGDIFSHGFKLYQLGPLIGKRTWGGVIGISPTHALVDGTLTTQPEYSFWFYDVGWGVENYGTDPDIEVDIRPQDYIQGNDPQLNRAIEEIMRMLKMNPPALPDFSKKPSRKAPRLPKKR